MTDLESVTALGDMDAVTPLQHLLDQHLLLIHLAAALLSLALGPITLLRRRGGACRPSPVPQPSVDAAAAASG